ncbi:PAS domain S-box protein [Ideonella livida]|uniref:PAS domain S-box protein n=1 Tax=Ideonella livida TaxID=2707176 RepID=A0A7C9TMK1_9BURK|nr:PAS domain S-box protein [Ideonella livida]NDY93023.1 PAS domain S-box protein [Ideonella livida]
MPDPDDEVPAHPQNGPESEPLARPSAPSTGPDGLPPEAGELPDTPSRLQARHVVWLTGLLLILVWLAVAAMILFGQRKVEESALSRADLHAQVLASQVDRQLAAAAGLMRTLAEGLADLSNESGVRLQPLLADIAQREPLMRSLSLLDARQQVRTSTDARTVGRLAPLAACGPLPPPSAAPRLGPLRAGLLLPDLEPPSPRQHEAYGLCLVLALQSPTGVPSGWLVAVLDPRHLLQELDSLIADTGLQVAVLGQDSSLVAGAQPLLPGQGHPELPALQPALPSAPPGGPRTALGQGLHGTEQLSAWRPVPGWSLGVLVEHPLQDVLRESRGTTRSLVLAGLVLSLLVLPTGAALWRSLRRDEDSQRRLRVMRAGARLLEARRRAILEASMDGILTFDAAGTVVDFNPAAELIFGRERTEVIGQPVFHLLPHRARARVMASLSDYLSGRAGGVVNQRVEMDGLDARGRIFPLELTVVPVRARSQLFFTATLRDITARREEEAERAALLERTQALATDLERQKLALDAHAIVSITDPFGRILYANAKLAELSGYSPTELLGRKHNLLKSGEHPDTVYRQLWRTITQGSIWHGELVNRRKDGERYWVAGTIVPVPGDDGLPRQYISIQTDISALRRAELALAQAREREVQIGARIQQSLLVTPPPAADRPLWLSVSNQASQGVDGDFVEFFELGPNCVDIVVGDVMGKGLAAALMGAATKLQFSRSMAELVSRYQGARPEPAAILAAVHGALTPHLQALDAFVTVCHVRLDSRLGRLSWVGCGHEEPLLLQHGQGLVHLHNQHPPLGVMAEATFTQDSLHWRPGDALFLCSDGVADAQRADGARVGRERVAQAFAALARRHAAPAAILSRLRQELLDASVQVNDDLTLVMALHPRSAPAERRLELAPVLGALEGLRRAVQADARAAGLDEAGAGLLTVASVEGFTNVIRHAVNRPPDAPIELFTRARDGGLEVDLVSLGEAFSPAPPRSPHTDFSAFPEGGFGLNIIRQACDRVQYLHEAGVNTLRLFRR